MNFTFFAVLSTYVILSSAYVAMPKKEPEPGALSGPTYNYFLTSADSFENVLLACQRSNGKLIAIEDVLEDTAVAIFLRRKDVSFAWTSGTEGLNAGDFIWATTSNKINYANWDSGYPHPGSGSIAYLKNFQNDYRWVQVSGSLKLPGICEL